MMIKRYYSNHLSLLAYLSLSISSSTSPTRTSPLTFLMRCLLSASLPEMSTTLTWVIPPLDPVLPNSWVTLALTGSAYICGDYNIQLILINQYQHNRSNHSSIIYTRLFTCRMSPVSQYFQRRLFYQRKTRSFVCFSWMESLVCIRQGGQIKIKVLRTAMPNLGRIPGPIVKNLLKGMRVAVDAAIVRSIVFLYCLEAFCSRYRVVGVSISLVSCYFWPTT